MNSSEIKQLEQQIDKNKNQILEEKEILDFIKDEKNLKSLGNFLKKLPMQSPYLSQKILNWIQASTLFNTQFQNWIKRKLQSNQSLTDKELQLLYIQAQIDPKCILKPQLSITSTSSPAFHISKTSLDRYWGKFLSQYLQAKYGKNSYSTAEERSDARFKNRNTSQEKQKEKEVRLPNINFKEGFSNVAIDRLQQRAKDNFYSELSKEKQWAQLRNSRKWEFKEAFVNYDLLLFAFNKYTELVNKKQEEAIKASGYKNAEDFFKQLKLIQDFNKFLEKKTKEKFPNLDQILASFSQFQKEQEALEKKYFKSNTEKQKIEQAFKNALKYQENLSKKYDLENIKKRFGSEPQKPEEAQKFFEDLNSLQAYQNELEAFQKRTQNVQNKYNSYLKDQQQLIQKYGKDNLKKSSEALHLYRIMLAWYKKAYSDINFDAYEKYGKIASKNRLTEEIATIQSLKEILLNPLHKDFPLHLSGVKYAEVEKQAKQAAIDKNWTMIKKNAPIIYTCLNAGTSVWNWLVDSTIGVWSSLGLMLKKLWESDDEWKSSAEFKEKFDNFFKISLSSSQKNSIYDSETGEFNMNWDNGVSQVASSISQMITLIYGGGAIAKEIGMGAAKTGLKLWSNIASKAGLFSMAFTQQVGQSFQEGMQAGMNGKEALAYSFLSSGLQGSLELISPNEILLGKGSSVAKGFIKELCKKGSKQSLKEVWKLFTTTIGKEIFEENIQEAVQLAAWNLMNQWANKTWGSELPSDWNLKNFAATAIITTLTTWVTTGASSLTNMPGILKNQDKAKLKAHILSNTELHADVMQVLEQAIEGKVNLSISKEDLITLKEELNTSQTNIKKIEVIQKNQETQSTDKAKYFEGKESKFWLSESNNKGTGAPGNKQNREQNNNEKTTDQISPLVQKINNSVFEQVVNSQELKLIASTEIENWMLEIGETWKIINAYIEINGEKRPSKLFKSLINGGLSSEQSLKSRLQTRTIEFKEWFGDWQTNPESASKIVDENGEPLVMWHWTTRKFNEFSHKAQRNYENIWNTKDWFYFSNLYNFSEKEYSWIGNINNALSNFYVTHIENYEWEDRLNYFENKRNDHIEGLSNGKTIINEMDHIMYEWQTTEGGFIKYCLNGKNPKTENFEKRERKWKVEYENGNIEEIPLNIYIPKWEIYFNPLPFFIKWNNVSQWQDFVRDQEISDMDYNINKAIENWNAKTDIIRVNDKNTWNIIIWVKDATQIKSAVNNDGSFSPNSWKFNDYFGKEARIYTSIDSQKARQNGQFMDQILSTINETNQSQQLQLLKEEISKQYQEATGKTLNLTNEQLLSVLDAHKQDGKLGELTLWELKTKVKVLDQTITDPEVRRFLLEAGFCSNESKINIVDFKKMNETEILEYAKNNFDTIIENYKKKYWNIVNADDFRDFVWWDIGVDANITHQAASYLADTYFEKLLEKNRWKGNNTIKFLAGGPWSGKSSISSISPNNDYAAVLDGTLKTYTNAERNIEKALSLGYNVRVEFVYRDMNESFINGVLKRTISQNQSLAYKTWESWLWRTVPLHIFEKGHNWARETILKLYDKYWPDVVKIFWGSDKNLDIWNGILQKTKTKNGIPPFVYEYDKSYTTNLIKENQFEKERSILAIQEAYLRWKITEKQKLELLWE